MTAYTPNSSISLSFVQMFLVCRDYTFFLALVAFGRDMQVPQVRAAARGQAWCGAEAVDLGLVDSLGGYEQAIAMAKTLAGLPQVKMIITTPADIELCLYLGGWQFDIYFCCERPVVLGIYQWLPATVYSPENQPHAGRRGCCH